VKVYFTKVCIHYSCNCAVSACGSAPSSMLACTTWLPITNTHPIWGCVSCIFAQPQAPSQACNALHASSPLQTLANTLFFCTDCSLLLLGHRTRSGLRARSQSEAAGEVGGAAAAPGAAAPAAAPATCDPAAAEAAASAAAATASRRRLQPSAASRAVRSRPGPTRF
jgi:hypothetical protein